MAGRNVDKETGKAGKEEKLKEYMQKVKEILLERDGDLRIKTPIRANGGQIVIVKYTTKGGNTRVGLRFEPNGSFRNAMTLNNEEHKEFLETIAKNINVLKKIMDVVVDVNKELETLETAETIDVDQLLSEIE